MGLALTQVCAFRGCVHYPGLEGRGIVGLRTMPFYHVWFATKRRKWLLQGDVLEAVREELVSAAERHGIRVLEHEAVVDHVHIFLELENNSSLSKAMNLIKGVSARRVFQRFPELKLDAHTSSFWQARYGFKEIPPEREAIVRQYIRTQWDRLEDYIR